MRDNYMTALMRIALMSLIWATWSLVFVAHAENNGEQESKSGKEFYKDRADGWHWYEDPPVPVEEPEEETPPPVAAPAAPTTAQPAPLSAEWLRTTLPMLRDAAIDDPTDDNVSAYFYAQRIMMDKAQRFSDKAQQVVTRDPLLDENLRLPFASAAKVAMLSSANDAKRDIVSGLTEEIGLWFFFDETCAYCKNQVLPINELVRKHGVTVQVIHKQGGSVTGLDPSIKVLADTGQFENLGITFTPSVMLMVPPDGFYLISQGFSSYNALLDKLVGAANEYGLISEEQFYAAVPTSRGILNASGIDDEGEIDWNNTSDWVPFIREQIAETYGIGVDKREGD